MLYFAHKNFIYVTIQGGRHNLASASNTSQATRHGPALSSGAPRGGPSMNVKVKQEVHMSSVKAGDKFVSNGQSINNLANTCDPKSLKVRLKVGSDNNLSTRNKAEIYSGLGLDVSPSSSLEASPIDSDDFCHDTPRDESPTSILEVCSVPNIFFSFFCFSRSDKMGLLGGQTSFVHFFFQISLNI